MCTYENCFYKKLFVRYMLIVHNSNLQYIHTHIHILLRTTLFIEVAVHTCIYLDLSF